jgi:GNAT superfamily N-acetyltransferase
MPSAPEPLAGHHRIEAFDSGVASLDDWLKRRALVNQSSGASRTYVTCEGNTVVGYYALASSAISVEVAPGRFRRNMPNPNPVVVLGRLAIARPHQGQGFGRALFQDTAWRVISAADAIGIRGMIVHALSDEARAFCLRLGLDPSPFEPLTLMVTVADLRASLSSIGGALHLLPEGVILPTGFRSRRQGTH